MARDGDDQLIEAIRQGLEGGAVALHVHYRKARRVDGFKESLVQEVGSRAVLIRDKFMGAALTVLLVWFLVAQGLDLHGRTITVIGSPLTLGFLSFAAVLLALVMFYRQFIKPIQGRAMNNAALRSPELFHALWQGRALALMTRRGGSKLCQSPRDDWRQFVRQTVMFGN